MKESRNPFRLRASEYIESDHTFIRLFSPEVLDALPKEQTWNKVHFLRSAEGGGKTSLLRLLNPNVLHTLYVARGRDECKELYQKLNALGAIGEEGPRVLGISLSCERSYAALEDMQLDPARKERLFFSLLNARILLAALRGAMAFKKLSYPADLEKLEISISSSRQFPTDWLQFSNGSQIFDWATQLEKQVCEAIDSFGPAKTDGITAGEDLISLLLITPESITIEKKPIAGKILIMFDDVQKLTRKQRERLLQSLIEIRSPSGVWVAERFEALGTDEMLSSGGRTGRDTGEIIPLENYWRDNFKKFERFVSDIADRRARDAADVEIAGFGNYLQSSLDGAEWHDKYEIALEKVSNRVRALVENHRQQSVNSKNQFNEWLEEAEKFSGTIREQTIAWRGLEILIERERKRNQRSLFDEPMEVELLREKNDSAVRASAQLFLAKEFELPYYFGQSMLSKLASANVEQFLWLAGDQFEEIVAAAIRGKNIDLSPIRQETLLKNAADALWNDIPKRIQNGRELRNFLEAIGNFSNWRTYQPTAPNDIGVNGIAVSMQERAILMDRKSHPVGKNFESLAKIISTALAYNLLEPQLDYNVKNKKWLVLNLNRLLCIRFKLPLHYGKFKERKLEELDLWREKGFRKPKRDEPLL